jgi:hypothetical protein
MLIIQAGGRYFVLGWQDLLFIIMFVAVGLLV